MKSEFKAPFQLYEINETFFFKLVSYEKASNIIIFLILNYCFKNTNFFSIEIKFLSMNKNWYFIFFFKL